MCQARSTFTWHRGARQSSSRGRCWKCSEFKLTMPCKKLRGMAASSRLHAALSPQGHYTVGLQEELDGKTSHHTNDFEYGPVDAVQFLDPSNETMSGMEFLGNAYLADSSESGEQQEQPQRRPYTEGCPRRVVQ
eukprot:2231251-Pyramimonas_sp.AAC.1